MKTVVLAGIGAVGLYLYLRGNHAPNDITLAGLKKDLFVEPDSKKAEAKKMIKDGRVGNTSLGDSFKIIEDGINTLSEGAKSAINAASSFFGSKNSDGSDAQNYTGKGMYF